MGVSKINNMLSNAVQNSQQNPRKKYAKADDNSEDSHFERNLIYEFFGLLANGEETNETY